LPHFAARSLEKEKDRRVLSVLRPALEPSITDRVIEAAYMMLDMQNKREGWKGADYAAAGCPDDPPQKRR
jgi:hypothetical protein